MKIEIIFNGKERRRFETDEIDESAFSQEKTAEVKAMLAGLEDIIGNKIHDSENQKPKHK